MEIEWDAEKDAANRAKHGVGLAEAARLDWATAVEIGDTRRDYGEVRRCAYLYRGARLFVCVYTRRDGRKRIISPRKANKREERRHGR